MHCLPRSRTYSIASFYRKLLVRRLRQALLFLSFPQKVAHAFKVYAHQELHTLNMKDFCPNPIFGLSWEKISWKLGRGQQCFTILKLTLSDFSKHQECLP